MASQSTLEPATSAFFEEMEVPGSVLDLSDRLKYNSRRLRAIGRYSAVFCVQLTVTSADLGSVICSKELRAPASDSVSVVERTRKSIKRLKREMEIWARLRHPNIVNFFGYAVRSDKENKIAMLISKWYDGGNVVDHLRLHPASDRIALVLDIAYGLSYLHDHGILHGDIKPENVLVDPTSRAALCDFGLASILSELSPDENVSKKAFSVRYSALELLMKGIENEKTDIYAFGCTSISILFDSKPFPNCKNEVKVLVALHARDPPWLWDLSSPLERMLASCCAVPSDDRPSMSEILSVLNSVRPGMLKPRSKVLSFEKSVDPSFSWSEDRVAICDGRVIRVLHSVDGIEFPSREIGPSHFFESSNPVVNMQWSADGLYLAWFCSESSDLYVRDVDGHHATLKHTGHSDAITTAAWNPRRNMVATGSRDSCVRFWGDGESPVLDGHCGSVHDVTWSVDGELLAAMDNQCIIIRSGDTFELLHRIERAQLDYSTGKLTFSPDGRLFFFNLHRASVEVWSGPTIHQSFDLDESPVTHLPSPLSHDAQYFAIHSSKGLDIYDAATFKFLLRDETHATSHHIQWIPGTTQFAVITLSELCVYEFIDRRPLEDQHQFVSNVGDLTQGTSAWRQPRVTPGVDLAPSSLLRWLILTTLRQFGLLWDRSE